MAPTLVPGFCVANGYLTISILTVYFILFSPEDVAKATAFKILFQEKINIMHLKIIWSFQIWSTN